MEFQSEAQKACYEKVKPWMHEIFGEFVREREDSPVFIIDLPGNSTLITTAIYAWGEDDATITSHSWVVTGAEMKPDLMQYLLRKNNAVRFGAFGLDDSDNIFFSHTIAGSTADKVEIKSSVMAVLTTADGSDEEIVAKWGGQRALDRTG